MRYLLVSCEDSKNKRPIEIPSELINNKKIKKSNEKNTEKSIRGKNTTKSIKGSKKKTNKAQQISRSTHGIYHSKK